MVPDTLKLLFEALAPSAPPEDPLRQKRLSLARKDLAEAERKAKMAVLLQGGDFLDEARQVAERLALAVHRLAEDPGAPVDKLNFEQLIQIIANEQLVDEARQFLRRSTATTAEEDNWLLENLQPALKAFRYFLA